MEFLHPITDLGRTFAYAFLICVFVKTGYVFRKLNGIIQYYPAHNIYIARYKCPNYSERRR